MAVGKTRVPVRAAGASVAAIVALAARALTALAASALVALAAPATASAAPRDPTGVIKLVRGSHLHLNASQSNNWFGYDQGSLEQGGKLFNAITANWTVPTATQHALGQPEASSDWIGIGGGCVDAGCNISDASGLIQTGTEQDVDATGHASYSAWWELVPAPSTTIGSMTVQPGDRMYASVAEVIPNSNLWTITLQDLTRHESFTQTVPYPSSHATAEWIEETPLNIDLSGVGLAALPNLNETPFDNATVNGARVHLAASEEIDLTNGSQVIGVPSAPDVEADGFGACAWATSCPVPSSSGPSAGGQRRRSGRVRRARSLDVEQTRHRRNRRRR
jgi:hypothetical protein